MKATKFRIVKKKRLSKVRRFKKRTGERLDDCWFDIKPYMIKEVMLQLKEQGMVYAEKPKNNKKKKKKKGKR